MFSKYKGTYGYLKKQPVRTGLISLGMVAFSAFIFLFGYYKTHDVKNLFTLLAVLGMLPASKAIVSFIMSIKAEKYTCSKELFEITGPFLKDADVVHGYDFYLTSLKENFPIPVCIVCDKSVICYLTDKKLQSSCVEHINKYLDSNGFNDYKAFVLTEEDKFINRLKTASTSSETSEKDTLVLNLMKNLSI